MAKDPRKKSEFDSVNGAILSDMVRHRLGLDQLTGSIRNDVIALLNEADEDVRRILQNRLEAGLSEGAARARHLQRMMDEIRRVQRQIHDDVNGKLKDELQDVADSENGHANGLLKKHLPIDVSTQRIATNQLRAIVTSEPFHGKTLGEWMEATRQDRVKKIRRAVQLGFAEGDSNQEIVRRVMGTGTHGFKDGIMQQGRHNVASVTRTAVTEVAESAREQTFQRSNVVKGVQYIATLDTRTTLRCQTLDGKEFNVGEGPRPPQHFACRSATTPITKSWRELGIDRDELDPSTRASMDGQVPSTTTYEEWLRGQSDERIQKTLGKTRAKLWKTGQLDLSDMVRDTHGNEVINLDTLRQREADVFEAAGL